MTSCLSFHAGYRCQHAGACCAAPWQVKADEHVVAFVSRSPRHAERVAELFVGQPGRAGQPAERSLAKRSDGVCVFREDRRCAIHSEAGESALPIGCRHYPRVVRLDRGGVSLSLSHYCPTAASLLASDPPVRVVDAHPPLALGEPIEGLDAREALPPLLRPEVLMDPEAYRAWELAAVEVFSGSNRADVALRQLAEVTDAVRHWTPGTTPLTTAVTRAFIDREDRGGIGPQWTNQGLSIARSLNRGIISLDSVANSKQRTAIDDQPSTDAVERVISNYLAARVFGNWIAYQGRGLRTIVTWIAACHDVVRLLMPRQPLRGAAGAIEAIRQADYVMLHTIDTQEFADAARGVER